MTNVYHSFCFLLLFGTISSNCWSADTTAIHATWKTIQNKYGWSIQYPPTWAPLEIGDLSANDNTNSGIYGPNKEYLKDQRYGTIIISPEFSSGDKDLVKFIRDYYIGRGRNPNIELINGHEITISGKNAYEVIVKYKVSQVYPKGYTLRHVVIRRDSSPFKLILNPTTTLSYSIVSLIYHEDSSKEKTAPNEKTWKYEKMFDEMLSTFKFTK